MKAIVRMNKWANAHTTIYLDALRILLGVFLFWKGMQFAGQTDALVHLIQPKDPVPATMIFAHYIAMSHLAGGVLVAFGLLTRLALVIQLPVLVGAVIVNFSGTMHTENLTQASLALAVSLFFVVVGSGKHSVDYNLKMNV